MFKLPSLPYPQNAFGSYISERTVEFHHTKHHQAYVDNLNRLVQGTPFERESLENIIRQSGNNPEKDSEKEAIFNNAAQNWNHTFFWNSLSPKGTEEPKEGPLKSALLKRFGSLGEFQAQFKKAAVGQFASGWAWLVVDKSGDLAIKKTGNADLPLIHGEKPLLTCDVWEHAYYLDYQNRRPDYVDIFLKNLINWSFVEECYNI